MFLIWIFLLFLYFHSFHFLFFFFILCIFLFLLSSFWYLFLFFIIFIDTFPKQYFPGLNNYHFWYFYKKNPFCFPFSSFRYWFFFLNFFSFPSLFSSLTFVSFKLSILGTSLLQMLSSWIRFLWYFLPFFVLFHTFLYIYLLLLS